MPTTTTPITRIERLNAAKAEKKALDAFEKNGGKGTRPATPNLDAINAEPVNTPGTRRRPTRPALVAPTPSPSQSVLPAKSAKHVTVLAEALGDLAGVAIEEGGVLYRSKSAPKVANALADFQNGHVYDVRLAIASLVQLMADHPDVVPEKCNAAARAVVAARAALAAKKVTGWSFSIEIDGTLRWATEGKLKGEGMTTRTLLGHLPTVEAVAA